MKFLVATSLVLTVLAAGPVLAQDALDRTEPTQADENADPLPAPEGGVPPPAIEASSPPQPSSTRQYQVGAIVITGARALQVSDFADIVERYGARTLSTADLAKLADEIAGRARSRGYIFATAIVEPQSLAGGVLRVRIDEGRVDRIRIAGDADAAVLSQLNLLISDEPVTLAQVERRLLLADDISGVTIRDTRYERENGEGVLIVEVARSRASGSVEFENDGSRPLGPERLRADLDLNGLILPADEFDLTVSTTPFEPQELQYGRASYRVIANGSGTAVGIAGSFSATEPGAYLEDRDIFGESWRIGLEVRHPLLRTRRAGVWAEGELELIDLRQEREGVLVRRDRIPILRAGLYTAAAMAGGRLRGRLTLSRGLQILGATEAGDPLASRDDASATFTALSGWADWERDLFSNFSLHLAGRGQLSADPLLSTQDLGLGGNRFLRGYNYSERTGDEGIMGSGEIRYDWEEPADLLRSLQIYAYADGGVVGNLDDGRGGGSLSSAGGGLRADVTRNLDLDLEIAVPLTGPRYDTGDETPRANVRVRQTF